MRALEGSLTCPVISAVFIWAHTAAALNRRAAARTAAAQNEDIHCSTNTKRNRRQAVETAGRACTLSPEGPKLVSPASRGLLDCPSAHGTPVVAPTCENNDSPNRIEVWKWSCAHLHLA